MSAEINKTPRAQSFVWTGKTCGLRYYIQVAARIGILHSLFLLKNNLYGSWYIWLESFRSFRGHIRTQSAKGRPSVDAGPWFEYQFGRYQRNARTLARISYIEKLRASRPWVDSQDLQIFLMGFDAGEEWSARKASP